MNRRSSGAHPILIVEDNDDDYEATLRALKHDGNLSNPIYRCEDGEEAIAFLTHQEPYADKKKAPTPGLILLDLNMPGRNGRSVLSEIKEHEHLRAIPIVVLTTSGDERDIDTCYAIGANSYVKKPVDLEGLFVAVRSLKEYWLSISLLPKVKET